MKLLIYTQEKMEFDYMISNFIFTAADGEVEIQPKHTSLMTEIDLCIAEIGIKGGNPKKIIITGGLCKVKDNVVKVLARTVEFPETLNKNRALDSQKRAEERIEKAAKDPEAEIDVTRAEAALRRSLIRLTSLNYK